MSGKVNSVARPDDQMPDPNGPPRSTPRLVWSQWAHKVQPRKKPKEPQVRAEMSVAECRDYLVANGDLLNNWEADFLGSVCGWSDDKVPTEKQLAALVRTVKRVHQVRSESGSGSDGPSAA
jgi:hypothetical protein